MAQARTRRTKAWWTEQAVQALDVLLAQRIAVVRPEAEATFDAPGWVTANVDPTFPSDWRIDPHHLSEAARALQISGILVPLAAELQRRVVTAWVDGRALREGHRIETERIAAAKRRTYRAFLRWTGRAELCGQVAERILDASLEKVRGRFVWLPPTHRVGRISSLSGRSITVGGPLDAAGHWSIDPMDPTKGVVPFAVEMKNVRSVLYPWDHEIWDLLAKVAAFPDTVPVLIARRIHIATFRFFADVGALGWNTHFQWFSSRPTVKGAIDSTRFRAVADSLGFADAILIDNPDEPDSGIVKFFSRVAYGRHGQEAVFLRQQRRWAVAAPIAAEYPELRDEGLSPGRRSALWFRFCREIAEARLYRRGRWAPPRAVEAEEEEDLYPDEHDEPDW